MANTLKQTVAQFDLEGIDKRMLVQYQESEQQEFQFSQNIVEYSSLTTEEKATFDAFQILCESKMQ